MRRSTVFYQSLIVFFLFVSTAFGKAQRTIYLTDLEGRIANLTMAIKGGDLKVDVNNALDFVSSDTKLVFGGDMFNRGEDSIKLTKWFVDLKNKYPDRVVLLWGNHDLNQLQLLRDLPELRNKYGDEQALMLKSWLKEQGLSSVFDFHKTELEKLSGKTFSDNEIAGDFIRSILPGGERHEYLKLGQIGHVDGNTLFVHGGVTDRNFGQIPGQQREHNPRTWIEKLNAWGKSELEKISKQYHSGSKIDSHLIAYGDAHWDARVKQAFSLEVSVIYPDRFKEAGNLRLPPQQVIDDLKKFGINQVIVGHTPMGNLPIPLTTDGFTYLMADTSYTSAGSKAYIRIINGKAVVRGQTNNGESVAYILDGRDNKIGILADDFHIAGKTKNGDYLLFQYYEKFKINEKFVTPTELSSYKLNVPVFSTNSETIEHLKILNQFLVDADIPARNYADIFEEIKLRKKSPFLFSGASKFSSQSSDEPLIRSEIKKILKQLDPQKNVIITGGTDFGVEKIVHEEVALHNLSHPSRSFELGAFIIDKTAPGDLNKGLNWVLLSGNEWDDPLMRSLDLVKDTNGKAVFIGGGGVVAAGIKKAAALDVDFRLMSNVSDGASVRYSKIYKKNSFTDAYKADIKKVVSSQQTSAEVVESFSSSGKKVLTFVGFSGAGYEHPEEVERIVKAYLRKLNPKEWIINIGVTPEGIGKAYQWTKELDQGLGIVWKYAKEFKEAGFETRGIVSSQGFKDLNDITRLEFIDNKTRFEYIRKYVDSFHIVTDESWGGYIDGKLSSTSEAMVSVSDAIIGIGGGPVGRDEMMEGIKRGKKVKYHFAEMNHNAAIAKAQKQGKPVPKSFFGDAEIVAKALKAARNGSCSVYLKKL